MTTVCFSKNKSIGDFLKELEVAYNELTFQIAGLLPEKIDVQRFEGEMNTLKSRISSLEERVSSLEVENHDLRQELTLMIASKA